MNLRSLFYRRISLFTTIGFFALYVLLSTAFAQPPIPGLPGSSEEALWCCSAAQNRCSEFPNAASCSASDGCRNLYSDGACNTRDIYGPGNEGSDGSPGGGGISNPIQARTFGELVQAIARAITAIGIPLVAIFLVWAGFLFVTARGNEQQLERAKATFFWAIVGGAVVIGAWAIAVAIVNFARSLG